MSDENAKSIGITAIKTEIAKLNPVDPKAVDDMVAHRLRIDALGVPYVVDKSGVREDTTSLEQFLVTVRRDHPHMFNSGGQSPSSTKNPFDRNSPHYNLSEGMRLYRTDPETAKRLAFEAGVKL